MSIDGRQIRRAFGIGLAWAALWLMLGFLMTGVIGIVDPGDIDPGDTTGMIRVFSLMGFLSGVAFVLVTSLAKRPASPPALSISQTVLWGILATAIVQIGFLGHGDSSLSANVLEALLLSAFGGLIAMSWFVIARRWWRSE